MFNSKSMLVTKKLSYLNDIELELNSVVFGSGDYIYTTQFAVPSPT